jgi:DNA end-binding protein Ku
MRTIWNGSISFGLVNIPVGLALATTPKAKQSDVSFRTLHRECKTPIRQKRWCPTHEREVGPDEIVKGWEVTKGEFVVVEDADLEAIAQHDDSRSIDITRFVSLDEVDPVYLDRTYYLAPAQAPAARRPYVLLLEAMKEAGMGAIGRFVLRGAEYFCLIRPKANALVLETLFLAEDVRSQAEIDEAVEGTEVKKAELDLAQQVMQSLVAEFEPSELESQYRSDLRAMLEAKLSGQEIAKPEPVPETPVVDLMDALKKSVAEAKSRKSEAGDSTKRRAAAKSGSGSRTRRAPARKSA